MMLKMKMRAVTKKVQTSDLFPYFSVRIVRTLLDSGVTVDGLTLHLTQSREGSEQRFVTSGARTNSLQGLDAFATWLETNKSVVIELRPSCPLCVLLFS